MKAQIVDFSLSFNRKQRLTVELDGDFRNDFDKLHDKPVEVTIKRYREKRSLDANGYLWALIGKIADALRESKDDIYFDMLKAYGQGGAVSVEEKYAEDFKRSYKYHEILGESQLNGKTFFHFRFWVGSSEYDTREMSILIDGVVKEAKNLDIETMTPNELKSLLEAENVRRTV